MKANERAGQYVDQKREYAEVAKSGAQQDIQKELAEVLRSLNNKLSGVADMKDKELDELLLEKLARSKHKRETIAAMRAETEAICGAVRPGEEEDKDEHLERAEKEMKEAGLQIWSQTEVRATKGEEWQGWLDALMEELDSIKAAGVHQAIGKYQIAKLRKRSMCSHRRSRGA